MVDVAAAVAVAVVASDGKTKIRMFGIIRVWCLNKASKAMAMVATTTLGLPLRVVNSRVEVVAVGMARIAFS